MARREEKSRAVWAAGSVLSVSLPVWAWLALGACVRGLCRIPLVRLALVRTLLRFRSWARVPASPAARVYLGLVGRLVERLPATTFGLQETLPPLPWPAADALAGVLAADLGRALTREERAQLRALALAAVSASVSASASVSVSAFAGARSLGLVDHAQRKLLRARLPLPLGSNAYMLDPLASHAAAAAEPQQPGPPSAAPMMVHRAAALLVALANVLRAIHTHTFPPNRVQDAVPLCMWQYTRFFATTRQPARDADRLVQHSDAAHVAVCIKSRWYRLPLSLSIRPLRARLAALVRHALSHNAADASAPTHDVSVLTSLDRAAWANQRRRIIDSGPLNRETLYAIETALFVLVLDLDNEPTTVQELAHHATHHYTRPLWFDKSFNLIVFKNGRAAFNVEQSWGDLAVFAHITDYIFGAEKSFDYMWWEQDKQDVTLDEEPIDELKWDVDEQLSQEISRAAETLKRNIATYNIQVLMFHSFGKGFIKKANMSPDAFCQMAIQLAYYRLHNGFAKSAEVVSTVRFQYGRNDLVRVKSEQSSKFVLEMCDQGVSSNQRLDSLRIACKFHARAIRMVTNGDGVDLYLSYLRELSRELGMYAQVLQEPAVSGPWVIYSAQIPSTDTLGAGFPPQCPHGYGITYTISEDRLWFHVSSYKDQSTNGSEFVNALRQALLDMKEICQSDPDLHLALIQRRFRVLNAE